jgi:MoaA/NifB/PqqE/SkfB family radical SAM enzyme
MTLSPQESASQLALKASKPAVYAKCLRFDERLAAGHSIALIQYQYRYNCNFKCSFCSISGFRFGEHKRALDISMTRRIFDQAHAYGLAHMGLSGGEPLTFPDFDELVDAVGPDRFHIQLDTNGWLMNKANAAHARGLGIDKVQVSVESADPDEHDKAVRMFGSWRRCMAAIDNVLDAGLQLQVSTVLWHERVISGEFERFMRMMHDRNAPVSVIYAKPCGEFAKRFNEVLTPEDIRIAKGLMERYNGYTHTTPNYGRDLGCLAVKRSVSITAFGEVLPCPWIYWTLGNVFDTPLADILDKGMRYFGPRSAVCRMSESPKFLKKYVLPAMEMGGLPTVEEVMGAS